MDDTEGTDRWQDDRTTFQRVYDVLVGSQTLLTAQEFADHASCSETGARKVLEQLVEMGIAECQEGRPAKYRRNESYLQWRRIESLAREHSPDDLRTRVDDLIAEDDAFQKEYGVPEPDAVSTDEIAVDNHETLHKYWENLSEWRTVRRDIRILRRAVDRAETSVEDGVRE
ncbi:TrmB family transcriptional regulator [Salinigranum halophilum]|uniref:TrmB family transcriptional regulator n=1 Tax=Salinigranum halophilum TaxID=2565931 RepID=UPI0010A7B49B|nr:TrmB family transcriptional regulator [Salinigranum halophilum]